MHALLPPFCSIIRRGKQRIFHFLAADCPSACAEAKAAISVGKKLKKAKVTLTRGEDIWSGTFDADKFVFSSMNLPEGEELDPDSILSISDAYIYSISADTEFVSLKHHVVSFVLDFNKVRYKLVS